MAGEMVVLGEENCKILCGDLGRVEKAECPAGPGPVCEEGSLPSYVQAVRASRLVNTAKHRRQPSLCNFGPDHIVKSSWTPRKRPSSRIGRSNHIMKRSWTLRTRLLNPARHRPQPSLCNIGPNHIAKKPWTPSTRLSFRIARSIRIPISMTRSFWTLETRTLISATRNFLETSRMSVRHSPTMRASNSSHTTSPRSTEGCKSAWESSTRRQRSRPRSSTAVSQPKPTCISRR